VIVLVIGKVDGAVNRTDAGGIAVENSRRCSGRDIECGEAVLPAGRRGYDKFRAAQQAVELRPFAGIGRQKRVAVETPFAGKSGVTVGVTHVQAQGHLVVQREAKVCALERIGIAVIDSRSIGVELVAKAL